MRRKFSLLNMTAVFMLLLTACTAHRQPDRSGRHMIQQYPVAARCDSVNQVFGQFVTDPYQWLEYDTLPTTADWIIEQRRLTSDYLHQIPYYDEVHERLRQLHDYDRVSTMQCVGGRYFYRISYGLADGSIIYVQESLNTKREVFYDANQKYNGRDAHLLDYTFSADGSHMAMVLSPDDDQTNDILVWDVAKRANTETIHRVRNTVPCWHGDGFFYGCYDAEGEGSYEAGASQQVRYHAIGTPVSQDPVVIPSQPGQDNTHQLSLYHDRYLFVNTVHGRTGALSYIDLQDSTRQIHVIDDDMQTVCQPLGMTGDSLYVLSTARRANGSIFRIDLNNPATAYWTELVTGGEYPMYEAKAADRHFIVTYIVDGTMQTSVYNLNGRQQCTIQVPNYATTSFQCSMDAREVFYTASSFGMPSTIYKYDIASNTSVAYIEPVEAKFDWKDPDDARNGFLYVTERVFATSADGTQVPIMLTYRKGAKFDGTAPCVLVGYGSLGTNILPRFDTRRVILLENGCIFAQVCARGGSEFGDAWHQAGARLERDNTFADFEAACRFLVEKQYTSADRLCLQASGIGALPIAVLANRHPELFSVGVAIRPVLDMMHYQHMRGTKRDWVNDWGTIEDSPEYLQYIASYDPITNLHTADNYPAIMCMTANREDKLIPAHSYKYIAALQNTQTGPEPKIINIAEGTHYKSAVQAAEEYTNFFCFFWYNIGMQTLR